MNICFATLIALSWAAPALAGHVIDQKVTYEGKGAAAAIFKWNVTEAEFRLDVTRGSDKRSFVFNGRVFYACGKLDKSQIDTIRKLKIDDAALLKKLELGVCQEVPTDFTTRFFFSPYEAVSALDLSGGFGSSMTVSEGKTEIEGTTGTSATVKCVNFKRSYLLKDKKQANFERAVTETACNAPTIKWRQGFARQLGMTLLRTPGSQPTYQFVNADAKTMAGFSLQSEGGFSGKDANGGSVSGQFKAVAVWAQVKDPPASDLGLPIGFEIIDTKNLASLASPTTPKGGLSGSEGGLDSVVRFFILGGNPAAAAVQAIREEKKDKK